MTNDNTAGLHLKILQQANALDPEARIALVTALMRCLGESDPTPWNDVKATGTGRYLWPRIGGRFALERSSEDIAHIAAVESYKEGGRARIVLSSCPGVREISRRIGHPVHAVDVSFREDALDVPDRLGQELYAANDEHNSYSTTPDPGFSQWSIEHLQCPPRETLLASGPVSVEYNALAIALPIGMGPQYFLEQLRAKIASCRLDAWALRAEGIEHQGVPAEEYYDYRLIRYNARHKGSPVPAELFLIDTGDGVRRLAQIAERLCLHFAQDLL